MDFPQYRKLSNNKVFYRINSTNDFDELMLIGSMVKKHHVLAKQYPEILRIQDMLNLAHEGYLESTEEEFEKMERKDG